MILQALVKEYENLAQKGLVSKPGWSQAKVSYAIDLNADGSIKVIYSLQTERPAREKNSYGSSAVICAGNGYTIFRGCSKFSV